MQHMRIYLSFCIAVFAAGTGRAEFGGWSIPQEMFDYIRNHVPEGSTILELGSGWASGELSKHYTVYSIEHAERWLRRYNTHYIHAPIVNRWYDITVLKNVLPALEYDCILVDGPPGPIGRSGFYTNLDLFNTNVLMLFDDINRPAELALLKNVSQAILRPYKIVRSGTKAFGIIAAAH